MSSLARLAPPPSLRALHTASPLKFAPSHVPLTRSALSSQQRCPLSTLTLTCAAVKKPPVVVVLTIISVSVWQNSHQHKSSLVSLDFQISLSEGVFWLIYGYWIHQHMISLLNWRRQQAFWLSYHLTQVCLDSNYYFPRCMSTNSCHVTEIITMVTPRPGSYILLV
jgi:hypothetical protein